jgi:molecular chaperone DnaK
MQKDADAHGEEDRKRREEAEARNRADTMVYNTEKLLQDNRDKISEHDAREIESAIEETKQAVATGQSAADIDRAVERLTKATHRLAEVMYQQTAGGRAGEAGATGAGTEGFSEPAGGPGGGKEGEVIDAEYVDADENKDK